MTPAQPSTRGEAEPSPPALLRHAALCAVVGLVVGALGGAFRLSLDLAERLRIRGLEILQEDSWPLHLSLPIAIVAVFLLGWAIGIAVLRTAPQAAGSGIQDVEAVLHRDAPMRWVRLTAVKFLGGAIGMGAGLSLGREGPTVQLGAAAAMGLGRGFGADGREIRRLLAVGAGAGLAAAFSAPLAGAVFVFEELRRALGARHLVGVLIACGCASGMVELICGRALLVPGVIEPPMGWGELPAVILIGVAAGAFGALLNAALVAASGAAARMPTRLRETLPGVALAATLLLALVVPQATGDGLSRIGPVLDPESARSGAWWLVLLLAAKLAATVVGFGSGAPGGIFSPMMLMGALLGVLFCTALGGFAPALQGQEALFGMLAMSAVFTASVRAPLTGIILVIELGGDPRHLVGLCLAAASAFLTARLLGSPPIYQSLLRQELHGLGKL